MTNKKADSIGFQFIAVLIVTLAGALIYFIWLKDYRTFGEDLADYTICKNSNFENAKLKLKIDNQVLTERAGNKCKTEYIDVPRDRELEFIAKKMAGCWDQYLEGKETLFETEDSNYCAFCSVLTFKDEKELNGLTNYLIENDAPGTGKKYHHDLTNIVVTNEVLEELENSHLNDLHTIDTSKPHVVMFTQSKDVNPGSFTGYSSIATGTSFSGIMTGIGLVAGIKLCVGTIVCPAIVAAVSLATGFGTGYLVGSSDNPDIDARILLWPYTNEDLEQLGTRCTMLEGKDRLDIRK